LFSQQEGLRRSEPWVSKGEILCCELETQIYRASKVSDHAKGISSDQTVFDLDVSMKHVLLNQRPMPDQDSLNILERRCDSFTPHTMQNITRREGFREYEERAGNCRRKFPTKSDQGNDSCPTADDPVAFNLPHESSGLFSVAQ